MLFSLQRKTLGTRGWESAIRKVVAMRALDHLPHRTLCDREDGILGVLTPVGCGPGQKAEECSKKTVFHHLQ